MVVESWLTDEMSSALEVCCEARCALSQGSSPTRLGALYRSQATRPGCQGQQTRSTPPPVLTPPEELSVPQTSAMGHSRVGQYSKKIGGGEEGATCFKVKSKPSFRHPTPAHSNVCAPPPGRTGWGWGGGGDQNFYPKGQILDNLRCTRRSN